MLWNKELRQTGGRRLMPRMCAQNDDRVHTLAGYFRRQEHELTLIACGQLLARRMEQCSVCFSGRSDAPSYESDGAMLHPTERAAYGRAGLLAGLSGMGGSAAGPASGT